jgi:squalene-associated FAD-dependent desaturase
MTVDSRGPDAVDVVDVVVIGAGCAGLAAAAMLAEAGRRVLVVEARPRLGGRATAFPDRVTGELVDNGQHVLFGCYTETLAFLRRIGAQHNLKAQSTLSVPFLDRDGRRSVLACPALPPPLHLLAAILRWEAMSWADRLSALRMALPLRAARRALQRTGRVTAAVDDRDMTVSQWLRARGQTEKLTEWLWAPLAVAALNQSPDEARAEPFVRVLAQMFGPDASASALLLPSHPLHLMYAEPARAFIERHGGEVRTGAPAHIAVDGGTVVGVEIRGERIPAARVISTVPWNVIRTLFAEPAPPALASFIADAAAMDSEAIVTVNLWYDRQVMEDAFVGLPGRAMQWIFDKRLAFGREASHLSLIASGANALAAEDTDDLIARAAAEVAEALPGARTATLVRGTVVRERHATFSLAPGQPPRPTTRTPIEGLLLAGDWIDTGLPGTIESAVMSGHWAAREALRT